MKIRRNDLIGTTLGMLAGSFIALHLLHVETPTALISLLTASAGLFFATATDDVAWNVPRIRLPHPQPKPAPTLEATLDWCAGCDQTRWSRVMAFTPEGLYRCKECRRTNVVLDEPQLPTNRIVGLDATKITSQEIEEHDIAAFVTRNARYQLVNHQGWEMVELFEQPP